MYEYVIEFEEIEKVVGDKAREFKEKAESIMVYLRLADDMEFDFNDFLYIFEFESENFFFNTLGGTLIDLINELKECFADFQKIFKEKTGIDIRIEYKVADGGSIGYFILDLIVTTIDEDKKADNADELLANLSHMAIKFNLEQTEWTF
jgi:hypothetical protein